MDNQGLIFPPTIPAKQKILSYQVFSISIEISGKKVTAKFQDNWMAPKWPNTGKPIQAALSSSRL